MNTVEIRRCPALAQTQVTPLGAVDAATIEAVRAAISEALRAGHTPILDTEYVSSVNRSELETLLGLVELYGMTQRVLRRFPEPDFGARERAAEVRPQQAGRGA